MRQIHKKFARSMFRFDHTGNVPNDDFNTFLNTSKRNPAMGLPTGLSKGPVQAPLPHVQDHRPLRAR